MGVEPGVELGLARVDPGEEHHPGPLVVGSHQSLARGEALAGGRQQSLDSRACRWNQQWVPEVRGQGRLLAPARLPPECQPQQHPSRLAQRAIPRPLLAPTEHPKALGW